MDTLVGVRKIVKKQIRKLRKLWEDKHDYEQTGKDSSLRRRFLGFSVVAAAAWQDASRRVRD
eukprot:6743762-Pyramimonas_sp.AAC.1